MIVAAIEKNKLFYPEDVHYKVIVLVMNVVNGVMKIVALRAISYNPLQFFSGISFRKKYY